MSTSLTRGLKILDVLVASGRPLKLAEIARQTALSKSSVHGLLGDLVESGYVDRSAGGIYRLGLKGWQTGHAMPTADLLRVATPVMEDLVRSVDEGAILGVLDGFDVVYIHLVSSRQVVRVHAEVGDRISAHSTSTGLALLSMQDPSYVERMMPPVLTASSAKTITDPVELEAELKRVRMRGYAINRGGWNSDVGGIAAPILADHCALSAGLCIALPRYRMTQDWVRRVAPVLIGKASEIGRALEELSGPEDRRRAS
jgi:IclR family transcriptional regulator, KDG regulon repressor